MKQKEIFVTEVDHYRLSQLLSAERIGKKNNAENLRKLAQELYRAVKVEPDKIDPDVVTMNSIIEFTDLDNNISKELKLVYPQNADIKKGLVSIMAPIGTALLGYRKGDIIEWDVPAGKKKFLIRNILYQPEANGEYMV
mgnify:CR=1 FL=1